MPGRQRVGRVPIRHQAADRRQMSLVLDVDIKRQAATERGLWPCDGFDRRAVLLRHRRRANRTDRHDAAIGQIEPGRHDLRRRRLARLSEIRLVDPFADQYENAWPRIIAHMGIREGAPAGGLVARPKPLARRLRPIFLVADQVEADRRSDDIGLAHQMEMVEVAGLDQILQRQTGEFKIIVLLFGHGFLR